MHGSYLSQNLKDLKPGDLVKVIEVHVNSTKYLTLNKEYEVLQVKTNPDRLWTNKFWIKTDTGKKRPYKFKNMMFKLLENKTYNEAQMRLMENCIREIEMLIDCRQILGCTSEATKAYEKEKSISKKNYLTQIVNAK